MERAARTWHLVTALVAAVALIVQFVLVVQGTQTTTIVPEDVADSPVTRVIRYLSYFTVQSNILVAVTAGALAFGRYLPIPRYMALIGITVTGIIYPTLLRDTATFTGLAAATNVMFHYLTPILTVVGWLLFGPRPRLDVRTLWLTLIWPAAYMVYTVVHGMLTNWYPYPFTDVDDLGFGRVLLNGVLVSALLLAIGGLYLLGDRRLRWQLSTRS